jgi:hypothetical protein
MAVRDDSERSSAAPPSPPRLAEVPRTDYRELVLPLAPRRHRPRAAPVRRSVPPRGHADARAAHARAADARIARARTDLARDFAKAKSVYEEILAANDRDPVARVMRDRCDHCLAEPPPEEWTGVYVAKEK